MKISLNWLKEFVDINKKPQEIADLLTLSGAEVESAKPARHESKSEAGGKKGSDYIFDLDITANRGDELSVLGIAREIAALTGKKIKIPHICHSGIPKGYPESIDSRLRGNDKGGSRNDKGGSKNGKRGSRDGKPLNIEIDDPLVCPRFSCCIIDDIEIKKSPKWLVDRLKSYGFRAINNVVDITNYVMIETGQPMHAFDYQKIKGAKMNIRRAKKGERVTTLDGIPRVVDEDAIVIEDSKRLIDLAGIMGGKESEVSNETRTIVLEAAVFNPVLIRYTSKKQALTTDASYRFERRVDHCGTISALRRATDLIARCTNAKQGEILDIEKHKYTKKEIVIDYKKVNKLLGTNINRSASEKYLKSLGFQIKSKTVIVPSWRNDIEIWQDVAEEIARMYGYDNLKTIKLINKKTDNTKTTYYQKELLKDILCNLGLSETYSYSFLSDKDVEVFHCSPELLFEVKNPVAPENRYLRDRLSPMLAKNIAKNPAFDKISIFELGAVFDKKKGERAHLAIALAGKINKSINDLILSINDKISFDLNWSTHVMSDEEKARYKIKRSNVEIAETDLSTFLKRMPIKGRINQISSVRYKKISKFPSVIRDLAFIVDKNVDAHKAAKSIKNLSPLIKQAELFDEFTSSKFGENKKSIAYHLQFQSQKKTLEDKEIDKLIKNIISHIKNSYSGKIRDF